VSVIRIALGQINPVVGGLKENVRKINQCMAEARDKGVRLIAFPELSISGYPPEDLLLKPAFIRACREALNEIVKVSQGITVIVGFPEEHEGNLYNAAAVICNGKLAGTYRKHYLPNYGVFDEDRYFAASRDNQVYVADGLRFGVTICEDMWYPAGPHEAQAALGNAELLINISASPYHRGKAKTRERMLAVRASDSVAAVAFCNLVGGQDELVFDGGSVIIDPSGNLLARGHQFLEELVIADIGDESLLRHRLFDPRGRKERLEEQNATIPVDVPIQFQMKMKPTPPIQPNFVMPLGDIEEVYQALVLGTHDYITKNGFKNVVIGLSGGIDSALVACVASDALGPSNVMAVSMPSGYTSTASKEDAAQLASALGIKLLTVPIEEIFRAFQSTLDPIFPKGKADSTEENLQSRIRGMLLMALSNKFGWLVLTTGNKSEMSVGYATLYGDMAGGFAVIKDVPKVLVYELCRYRNTIKPVIPENIFRKAPTAELRPNQKDTDTLPEYSELDPILRAYIEQNLSFPEMSTNGFDARTVQKVVKMVDHAEYKRRQAPPGVKITPRALGKDWRLPLTNHFVEEQLH